MTLVFNAFEIVAIVVSVLIVQMVSTMAKVPGLRARSFWPST